MQSAGKGQAAQIDGYDVGRLPRRNHANLIPPQCLRAAERGGLKLLLQPALVAVILWLFFPTSRAWAAVALLMAGMPTAINVTAFAKKYEACVAPVAAATLLSSLLVIVSSPVLLVVLR